MKAFIYILSNKNRTVFYTGVTNDLLRRILEHKSSMVKGFTWRYNCTDLMYYEEFQFIQEAIAREKILKKYRRDWKLQLIRSINPAMTDLAKDW